MDRFTDTLIITILITGIVPLIAYIIDTIEGAITRLLCKVIGFKAAIFVMNNLTFTGTIHHELSHALVAFLTGAKVRKVELFKPDKEANTLGKVVFTPRGPLVLKSIQIGLTSVAPIIFVGTTSTLLIQLLNNYKATMVGWQTGIILYVITSILIHMRMSKQDIKNYIKVTPVLDIIIFIIIYIVKFCI